MLPPSPGLLPSFVTHPSVPPDPCVYRRAPGELTGSPLVKIQSKLGKLRSFGPCDITTGRGTRFMDAFVSVTDANLKEAAVQFGCFPPDNCWQRLPAMWKLEFVALLRLWCTDLLTAAPSADSRRSQVTARLTLPVRPTFDAGRAGPGVFGSCPTRFWRRDGHVHVSLARHLGSDRRPGLPPPAGGSRLGRGLPGTVTASSLGRARLGGWTSWPTRKQPAGRTILDSLR